jgi:cytochrome c-type biogenesis protein CcmH
MVKKPFRSVFILCLLWSMSQVGFSAIDAYEFSDQETQERYRDLVDELRCPQCLNTNLAGSDSMIAKDLRREIHRLIQSGKSDDEIRQFMYERYGDFILYRPRVNETTALLWFGPLLLLVLGLWLLHRFVFLRSKESVVDLSEEDQRKLHDLLDDTGKS